MKNRIKYYAAKFLRNLMMPITPSEMSQEEVNKFNHLQGIIISLGKIKWNWKKILKMKMK